MPLKNLPSKSRRGILWSSYYYLRDRGINVHKHPTMRYLTVSIEHYKINYYPIARKFIVVGNKELNDEARSPKQFYEKLKNLTMKYWIKKDGHLELKRGKIQKLYRDCIDLRSYECLEAYNEGSPVRIETEEEEGVMTLSSQDLVDKIHSKSKEMESKYPGSGVKRYKLIAFKWNPDD